MLWLVLHVHDSGVSYLVIESDERPDDDLIEQYITKELDYEPDLDEYFEIEAVATISMSDIVKELSNG